MTTDVDVSELPFRQLAQHLPLLCWIADESGQILWVNEAWLAYTGIGLEALADDKSSLDDLAWLAEVRLRWKARKRRRSLERSLLNCVEAMASSGRF
ncbi:MAG: PAS domain-containing protein [Hyphomonadaceae bacterium]|nr:PAS domain-containing protein [Hyphomonadaceae bacterium]